MPREVALPTSAGLQQRKCGEIGERHQPSLNSHESALVGMTQLLESMIKVVSKDLLGRTKWLITGFDGVVVVAIERVEDLFGQNKPPTA